MKVHYINILLFSLPLNILMNNNNKPSITHHTPVTRLLCECELYAPANYDNDQEMKKVMQQFEDCTSQRFHKYDERMKTTRQKCKEQCDKEIQKIILKDKLEKQMEQQLNTLEAKIDTDDIPTCICKKSLAYKMEKGCLRCGGILGGGVMPGFSALGGTTLCALNQLKPTAIATAIEEALKAGATRISTAGKIAGEARGMEIVNYVLKQIGVDKLVPDISEQISSTGNYTNVINFSKLIIQKREELCSWTFELGESTCKKINIGLGTFNLDGSPGLPDHTAVPKMLKEILKKATQAADAKGAKLTAEITKKQTALIEAEFNSSITSIYASIIAIIVIVLIMVIIYLILRYRRKKKMKKKLQYIKLLEE
ncbi:PIR protein, putative [Plasmodium sp.]|nr:PIR protein, putative [Plasmodium sp.]